MDASIQSIVTPNSLQLPQPGASQVPFRDQVFELLDRGIPKDGDTFASATIGFHGTGLLTFQYLMKTGILPASARQDVSAGYLYFAPRPGPFSTHKEISHFGDDAFALKHARAYARDRGGQHFVASFFGLDLSVPAECGAATVLADYDDCIGDDVQAVIARLGYSRQQLRAIESEAKQHEGVVLGLHADVMNFGISDGDFTRSGTRPASKNTPADLRIRCPEGLPLHLITGIEAYGQKGLEFLEALRANPTLTLGRSA